MFLPFFPQLEPMSLLPPFPVFVSFDAVAAIRDEILMQTSGGPLYVIATAGWTQAVRGSQAVLSRVEFNIKLKPLSDFPVFFRALSVTIRKHTERSDYIPPALWRM